MKKIGNKCLAVCISVSLCAASLFGCGASDETPVAEAQAEDAKTQEEDAGAQAGDVGEIITFSLPDGSEESEIYVEPIADIADDFIRGMDASSVLSLENSGVTYYNYDGCFCPGR